MDARLARAAAPQSLVSQYPSPSRIENVARNVDDTPLLELPPSLTYPSPSPPSDDQSPIPSPLPHTPLSPPRPQPATAAAATATARRRPAGTSSASVVPYSLITTSTSVSTATSASTDTTPESSSTQKNSSASPTLRFDLDTSSPTAASSPVPLSEDSSSELTPTTASISSTPSIHASPSNTPHVRSPSSSAFISASNSPFFSPSSSTKPNPFVTQPTDSYVSAATTPRVSSTPGTSDRYFPYPPHPSQQYPGSSSREITEEIQPVRRNGFRGRGRPFKTSQKPRTQSSIPAAAAVSHPHHHTFPHHPSYQYQASSSLPPRNPFPAVSISSSSAPPFSYADRNAPTTKVLSSHPTPKYVARTSISPSSSARPRSCDVYISVHGPDPALLRFSKWMKAELELQGVACFSADRSLYSEQRSHDIAMRIINSATFGVVIVSRRIFRNPYSIEELRIFLERKNLVPLFFDLTPADCLMRDIVERRGEVWEGEGGELWKVYEGQEREWKDAVEGLLRVEDWRLEAHDGNWRACIQRTVGLVGSRLGRRSIADRERLRWEERIDLEEFPLPRNESFVGRERELKVLEGLLFHSERDLSWAADLVDDRGSRDSSTFGDVQLLRKSNAEMAQVTFPDVDADACDSDFKEGDLLDEIALSWRNSPECINAEVPRRGPELDLVDKELMYRDHDFARGREPQRGRPLQRERRRASKDLHMSDHDRSHQHNFVSITGVSGIGKTELALEFAYRNLQKYRMVLWVGGESRYIRQNYLNLSMFLGVDVGTENSMGPDRGRVRSFEELEEDAFQKVKRELQRDVPYLIIIDNLEMERDWWDGREISSLLPRAGCPSHVIITTRLSQVLQLESLELSFLSGAEALTLMRGGKATDHQFSVKEFDKLKELEDRLGRLTLGLAIAGRVLRLFQLRPAELLEKMRKVVLKENAVGDREDAVLRGNPHLVKLLDVCIGLLGASEGAKYLAMQMALVGGWFAPYAVPFSLLALAASRYKEESSGRKMWSKGMNKVLWCCVASQSRRMEAEAGALLIKCGVARRSSHEGCLRYNEIVQIYSRKRGGEMAAKAAVHAVRKAGVVTLHYEHFSAASFLVFRFGNDPVMVDLKVSELLLFAKRVVIPVALKAFTGFSRCNAGLELLRLCHSMLEEVEKSFASQIQEWDKSLCWKRGGNQVDEYVWQDLTLLKATILEMRAKLMLKGGQFDTGEEACRKCINIRTVMLGPDHAETITAQETLAKLVRFRNTM